MNKSKNLINSINVFMDYIYKKDIYKSINFLKFINHKRQVKKFKKSIYSGSPSFNILWQMSDFIKHAEFVFFYDNSVKNSEIGLYSSKNYQDGTNGFKLLSQDCDITIKLFWDSKSVILEIARNKGDKVKTILNFKDEQWVANPSIYEEMALEQVIKLINDRILKLFDFCYNLR